jgi:hypothetical protein
LFRVLADVRTQYFTNEQRSCQCCTGVIVLQ